MHMYEEVVPLFVCSSGCWLVLICVYHSQEALVCSRYAFFLSYQMSPQSRKQQIEMLLSTRPRTPHFDSQLADRGKLKSGDKERDCEVKQKEKEASPYVDDQPRELTKNKSK